MRQGQAAASPPLGTSLDEALRAEAGASEAGARVFSLAEAAGVFFSHFEYHQPPADPWAPTDRPDLGEVQGWNAGVLPETKFRQFRLDRPVASYHPGQSPKWTAHELCHQLVGFSWWPGMSRLEVACMARLAEALPVALWYFFDHDGPDGGVENGRAFLAREIDGVVQSLRTNAVVATPWATIDLASDGLAWASAHGERLGSPEFAAWMEGFRGWGDGWRTSIDELLGLVEALGDHIAEGGRPVVPVCAPSQRVRADVAWRLLALSATLPSRGKRRGLRAELRRIVSGLGDGGPVGAAIAAYRDMQGLGLPPLESSFATGYRLGASGAEDHDVGLGVEQLVAGLESALPLTLAHIDDRPGAVAAFVAQDRCERRPLGRRFAGTLPPGALASSLAALEAALVDPRPAPLGALALRADLLPATPLVLSPAAELVQTRWEVLPALEGEPPYEALSAYLVVRGADGDPRVFPLSPWAQEQVQAMAAGPVVVPADDDGERSRLVDAGAWVAAPAPVPA